MAMRQPLKGAHVWNSESLAASTGWTAHVDPAGADELLSVVHATERQGMNPEGLGRHHFLIPSVARSLAALSRELEYGTGFCLLRGLPVAGLSEVQLRILFWAVNLHLGMPVSQSKNGEFVGKVMDIGVKKGQPDSRAYRTGGELRYHVDRCDVLTLLCVREPISGGRSKVVSSAYVYNEILRRRPELLELLHGDFCFSRQQEQVPGEHPWFARPVYEARDGHFTSQFSLTYIESAQRFDDAPRLTEAQREALNLVAQLSEEYHYGMQLREGDLQLLNNHVTYHARTNYEDHVDPVRKRLLLRGWLATPNSRALPEGDAAIWGSADAGALRGGVTPASGSRHAFASWEDAGWDSAARRATLLHSVAGETAGV